jgi:cysteine-rich repeat protein
MYETMLGSLFSVWSRFLNLGASWSASCSASCKASRVTVVAVAASCAWGAWCAGPSSLQAQTCTVGTFTTNSWGGATRDYVYCSNAQSWTNAQTACASLAGGQYRLVTIDNLTEDTNVAAFSGSNKWIGYNDRTTENTFVWDGIAPSGAYVNASFTNNNGTRDCTRQNTALTWTVQTCGNNNVFVCEDVTRCGNGIVSGTETCDDGNTTNNDGCSSTCQVEYPYTCSNTTFPGTCTAATNCANSRSSGLGSSEYVYCGVTTRTWDQARTTCQGFGTGWDLAQISSETENTMIYNMWASDGTRGTSMFHACRDITADGSALNTWQWVTDNSSCRGSGAVYQNWGPGEPNNGNPTQGCGSFWTGVPYQWDDLQCTATVPFICEGPSTCGNGLRAPGSEQCDDGNTTNGDGCSSTCTIETPPVCGDGAVTGGEGCDDDNTTNGDGCSSTCTVEAGYTCVGEPSVCTTACTGGTWLSSSLSNGTEYYRCTTAVQWGVGRNNCTTLGTGWNLVTVDDGTENSWVQTNLLGGANRWIGANDTNAEGVYEWSSGTAWGSYINWAAGEPSNAGATDDCAIMLTASGAWDIQTCSNTFGYVCEGPPLCGNGVRATTEGCDDGNLVNGDGCSSTCVVEGGYTCTNSTPSTPSVCTANCAATPTWSSYLGGTSLQTTEYYYCTTAVTWTNAQTNCDGVASSWAMVTIAGGTGGYTAAQENAHISGQTSAVSWTGLNDVASEGNFVWEADNSALGAFTNWETGQPNNSPAGSNCVAMLNNGGGTWDDLVCTNTNAYVCEGPPVCGNGVLASPEGCDDGNLINADGCSSSCAIESGFGCTPTNPSVCNVVSLVAVDSLMAYLNPSGVGVVIEWVGLFDPSSRGFDVVRRRTHATGETTDTQINDTELQGTAFVRSNQVYKVTDVDGTLQDVYFVIEKKFDGTATRYSALTPTASRPTGAQSTPSSSTPASGNLPQITFVGGGASGGSSGAVSAPAGDVGALGSDEGCSISSISPSRLGTSRGSFGSWLGYVFVALTWVAARRSRGAGSGQDRRRRR